jgi:two-component system response regulator PilR (NtrC family)
MTEIRRPHYDLDALRSPRVLVVDDESDLRELLGITLGKLGLDVVEADCLSQARDLMGTRNFALCLTDMKLPDGEGLELVREVSDGRYGTSIPIAVITAYGSMENAVAALKAGAFDYLTKPVDLGQLRLLVRSALANSQRAKPEGEAADRDGGSGGTARLTGNAPSMRQLRAMIERIAGSMAPVAICGESGSGKEVVARAIHETSARRAGPFVAVNCGAIPEQLMEAEFFGYRKGAFTGANDERDGFFQAANGGTLFLDEVAELPLTMQVKLLRAIQERQVRKLGAATERPVDVRVLSATNQDLSRLVVAGRFRQELFYRLNVIELRVPSLRERVEDIPALAQTILTRISQRNRAPGAELSAGALEALCRYPFPGNVREMENILERAVALAENGKLQEDNLMLPRFSVPADDLDASSVPDSPENKAAGDESESGRNTATPVSAAPGNVPADLQAYVDSTERDAILAALEKTHFNRTAAAQLLGITFRQLRYRMQRLGVK